MGQQLQPGDVFLLKEGDSIFVKLVRITVGKVYNRKTDYSQERYDLRVAISDLLYKKGTPVDYEIVKDFIDKNVPDKPKVKYIFPVGHFVVTRVDKSGGTNSETVYCTRFNPEPGQNDDEINFYQNMHGVGDYPFSVLMTLPPGGY